MDYVIWKASEKLCSEEKENRRVEASDSQNAFGKDLSPTLGNGLLLIVNRIATIFVFGKYPIICAFSLSEFNTRTAVKQRNSLANKLISYLHRMSDIDKKQVK